MKHTSWFVDQIFFAGLSLSLWAASEIFIFIYIFNFSVIFFIHILSIFILSKKRLIIIL
jgi:hypothetical protein